MYEIQFLFSNEAKYVHTTSQYISASLHASGNYVPIISRAYFIYATLVLF